MDKYDEIIKKYNYPVNGEVNSTNSTAQNRATRWGNTESISTSTKIDNTNQTIGGIGFNKNGISEKVGNFTGGTKIAQGLGQNLAMENNSELLEGAQTDATDIQTNLIKQIRANKAVGKDTAKLEKALADVGGNIKNIGDTTENILNPNQLTNKQVLGDALQLGATIAGVGTYGKGTTGVTSFALNKSTPTIVQGVTKGNGIINGLLQGVKTGVIAGSAEGAVQGFAQGIKNDESVVDSLKQGGIAGLIGGGLGGVLGGTIGGISGGLTGRKLNQAVIKAQEESGIRTSLTDTVALKSQTNPTFKALVKDAQKQGYSDSEINFLSSVQETDKPVLKRMFDVTAKAQSDPRQIIRAADILGENATGVVRQIQQQNSKAGQLVEDTAKTLKGQPVDVTNLRNGIESKLDDSGIILGENGQLDFSQSVFKNTPKLQKEIQRVLLSTPDGSDAYQVHIFKKSIDELVNYGAAGEGLSGQAASILKSFRSSADDVLDNSFESYNAANTDYKLTRDFIDEVRAVVGKKVDFSTQQGAQAFGQAFRSAFSNNKSRGATLALIENLQNIAKTRNLVGAEQNLLDQALYVNMLEDTFGSQAATGLAGEVGKAIKTATKAVDVIRSPISAGLDAIADVVERSRNITPEAKKQLLQSFLD